MFLYTVCISAQSSDWLSRCPVNEYMLGRLCWGRKRRVFFWGANIWDEVIAFPRHLVHFIWDLEVCCLGIKGECCLSSVHPSVLVGSSLPLVSSHFCGSELSPRTFSCLSSCLFAFCLPEMCSHFSYFLFSSLFTTFCMPLCLFWWGKAAGMSKNQFRLTIYTLRKTLNDWSL